jgi:hypothetical protein
MPYSIDGKTTYPYVDFQGTLILLRRNVDPTSLKAYAFEILLHLVMHQ